MQKWNPLETDACCFSHPTTDGGTSQRYQWYHHQIAKKLAPNNSAAAGVIPPRKKKKETRQVSSDINKCPWWPKFQVKIRDSKPQKNIIGMEMNNDRNHPAANLIYMSVINSSPTNLIKAKRRFQRRFYRNVWNKIHQHQPNIQHDFGAFSQYWHLRPKMNQHYYAFNVTFDVNAVFMLDIVLSYTG